MAQGLTASRPLRQPGPQMWRSGHVGAVVGRRVGVGFAKILESCEKVVSGASWPTTPPTLNFGGVVGLRRCKTLLTSDLRIPTTPPSGVKFLAEWSGLAEWSETAKRMVPPSSPEPWPPHAA